jgi:hypothetical protein
MSLAINWHCIELINQLSGSLLNFIEYKINSTNIHLTYN